MKERRSMRWLFEKGVNIKIKEDAIFKTNLLSLQSLSSHCLQGGSIRDEESRNEVVLDV